MEPVFREFDRVFTVNFGKIMKGSVIVFKEDGRYLIKRVKELKGDKFIVEADNKKLAKKTWNLTKSQIIGRVFLKY